MMTIIEYPFYAIGSVYMLWILYLAIMNLQRARDAGTMSMTAKAFAIPIVAIGGILDIAVNLTVGSALFMEPPKLPAYTTISKFVRDLTLSARLNYYWNDDEADTSWRKRLAGWLARNFLNTYDPDGQHIT